MTDQPVKRKPGRPKKERPADDKFNGAPPEAFDHDADGHPGGSLPRNTAPTDDDSPKPNRGGPSVGKHELEALTREAFEAYDMQDDRIRFDSLARRWEFRMSSESGFWELRLSLSRGLSEIVDAVPQPVLGGSQGMSVLFDKIAKMDEAVR